MLVKYKKSFEKIAMGLLSFIPEERDLKNLQRTISEYTENPDWQLYLWKEGEDVIGLVGVEMVENSFKPLHVSVSPSHRGEGLGSYIVEKVEQAMGHRNLEKKEEIKEFLDNRLTKDLYHKTNGKSVL